MNANVHRAAFLVLLAALLAACGTTRGRETPKSDDPARAAVRVFWQEYGRATQLRTSGKPLAAAQAYRDALKQNPTHEDSLYYLAVCLMDTGDYGQAVPVLEDLVTRNAASHRGNFQLGVALSTPLPGAVLDFERARKAFQRNIEINREESGPFLRLGELELSLGHLDQAKHYFETAAGFQSPEGLFRAGFVRYLSGQYGGAAEMFRRVLELNAREKTISGRGVQSEGDVASRSGKLTPLERAGLESLIYLYWSSRRLGRSAPQVTPGAVQEPVTAPAPFRFVSWPRAGPALAAVPSMRDMWDASWRPMPPGTPAGYLSPLSSGRPLVAPPPASIQLTAAQVPSMLGDASHPIVDLEEIDLDGDSGRDLVFLSWKRGLRVFRQTAPNAYEDWTGKAALPSDGADAFAIAVLDFDRDGKPDLLVSAYAPYVDVLLGLVYRRAGVGTTGLRLFQNLGGGVFREKRIPGLDGAHGTVRAIPADFDGDGFPDLLLANGGLDPFRLEPSLLLRNEGGQAFSVAAYLPAFDRPVRALGASVADLDADGRMDVCLRTTDGLLLFRNLPAP